MATETTASDTSTPSEADGAVPVTPAAVVERAAPDHTSAGAVAAGLTRFGATMIQEVATPADNVVLSPGSIGIAFGMARAGARGDTAAQIDGVFGFSDDNEATNAAFKGVSNYLCRSCNPTA